MVNVPRAKPDSTATDESAEAEPSSGFANSSRAPRDPKAARPIVVVDDDAVSRHVLSSALTRAGLEHVTLGSGAGALSYLATHDAELVLLDLVMPDPDGYEILRVLRESPKTRSLPIVVLTGVDADEEVTRAFTAGADDFVKKPFRADELVARVRGQLRLRAIQSELRHRERDLEVVLELTQVLASNLDVRGILQTVVQRTAEVAQIDRVSIVLAHNDTSHGVVIAASDDDSLRDLPIALDRYPEISEVLRTGEPLVIDDAQSHPVFVELEPRLFPATFRSLVILPIAHDDKPLGVLFLRAQERRTFSAREIGLCRTIASAMAIALSNARRFQDLHEQTQQVTVEVHQALGGTHAGRVFWMSIVAPLLVGFWVHGVDTLMTESCRVTGQGLAQGTFASFTHAGQVGTLPTAGHLLRGIARFCRPSHHPRNEGNEAAACAYLQRSSGVGAN